MQQQNNFGDNLRKHFFQMGGTKSSTLKPMYSGDINPAPPPAPKDVPPAPVENTESPRLTNQFIDYARVNHPVYGGADKFLLDLWLAEAKAERAIKEIAISDVVSTISGRPGADDIPPIMPGTIGLVRQVVPPRQFESGQTIPASIFVGFYTPGGDLRRAEWFYQDELTILCYIS